MADTSKAAKAVLITGCSTGIGRAGAEHLAGRGWTVYATARRPESIEDLKDKGCRTLALDVTDEQSMSDAVKQVEDAEGAVGVLVNNAGYSQSGAVESVNLDDVRGQFETNVFGLIRCPHHHGHPHGPPGPGMGRLQRHELPQAEGVRRLAPRPEEARQQRRALVGEQPARDLGAPVEARLVQHVQHASGRARL